MTETDPREGEEREPPVDDDVAEEAGAGDEHSDAPGETGTGSREGDPEHGKPYRQ
jgi:hypothetical protein